MGFLPYITSPNFIHKRSMRIRQLFLLFLFKKEYASLKYNFKAWKGNNCFSPRLIVMVKHDDHAMAWYGYGDSYSP